MTNILFATHNAHKTRDIAQMLGPEFCLRDLARENGIAEIAETGATFAENAAIKALAVSRIFPDEFVIADDSGLEVDALGGAPGIFSARYAGEKASDRANVEKLLSVLATAGDRSARFVCIIVLAKHGEVIANFDGNVRGRIIQEARGENGFGYDPVFVPNGFEQTFAELPATTKNKISHRGQAVKKLVAHLKTGE